MKTPACTLLAALLFTTLPRAYAADYEGADAILKQLAAKGGTEPGKAGETSDTPEKIRTELEAFRKTAPMLAPDEAAKGWLDLADRFSRLSQEALENDSESNLMQRSFGFQQVVAALPPPAAWAELAKQVEARPTDGNLKDVYHTLILRLIVHRLLHDNAALGRDIATLQGKIQDGNFRYINNSINELKIALLEDTDNGMELLKQLDSLMASSFYQEGEQTQEVAVPDLVTLVGREKATEFLKHALRSNAVITPISGDETTRLARTLALEMVAEMKTPQWPLAKSIDATALFEAMQKRFPVSSVNAGRYFPEARTYYLLGLIDAHRTKEATAFALGLANAAPDPYQASADVLPEDAINALERAGRTTELADFFYDLLSQSPDLPFWGDYVDIAVKSGQQKNMVALAESSAARTGLNEKQRQRIQGYLSHAYLATDRVDEGVAILRKEIADAKKSPGTYDGITLFRHRNHFEEAHAGVLELAMELAKLGAVLNRKDLVDEGIQTAREALKQEVSNANTLATLLIELDRGPEAEAVLKEALLAAQEKHYAPSQTRGLLVLLMDVYHRANRPADVLALLDHAPLWGAKDLADILMTRVEIDRNVEYAGYFAADALAASGREPEARKILDAVLDQAGDYDPAYELLIKIAPREEVLAKLDVLYGRDKYESRPMIWKAKVLLDAGKLEEAEAAARQGVTIDPSDGEHGPGRRMRVYSVLADIREARGDKKEAEFFRGVVTSIRHSENADRFYEAGLITQAIKMYEESLTHFADAYCIQSRLALRLAEVGDMAGAEEHYRRAYELMPDSFGRVESHCFGCEGAFQGYYAQNIAEKVFTDLAKKRPDKPQVHYLLGYLREEQERYNDAQPEFREAVKLDPEYLNAWKKIAEVAEEVRLPAAERDSVELNLIRLDPLGRHSDFNASNVIDLAAAWNALEAASKLRPTKPTELYPLPAAVEELAKREKERAANPRANQQEYYDDYFEQEYAERREKPGSAIANNRFIELASQIYTYVGNQ